MHSSLTNMTYQNDPVTSRLEMHRTCFQIIFKLLFKDICHKNGTTTVTTRLVSFITYDVTCHTQNIQKHTA